MTEGKVKELMAKAGKEATRANAPYGGSANAGPSGTGGTGGGNDDGSNHHMWTPMTLPPLAPTGGP
jgi:hypothetical protein